MPPDVLAGLETLWRRQRYEYLTGSRIICKTPGFLIYAKMKGAMGATGTVTLYDGESANEPPIIDFTSQGKATDQMDNWMPVPFQRGLYAAFGAGATSLTVVIITVKE